jgi:hypothetical protein
MEEVPLQGIIGVTLPRSQWSGDRGSIMMHIEVLIRCSQPPSRGFFRSLLILGKQSGSPEMPR